VVVDPEVLLAEIDVLTDKASTRRAWW